MKLHFDYLADRPELTDLVIEWWYTAWGDRMGDKGRAREQLRASLSRDSLPIHILASLDGEPVGTAALKLQELIERYPDRQYWLGSVFVAPQYRGRAVASELSRSVIDLARDMNLPHLHLQTVSLQGGLYSRLGWEPVESFNYRGEDALLMIKPLQ